MSNKNSSFLKLKIDGRDVSIKYSDLGMNLDVEKTMEAVRPKSIGDLLDKWLFSPSRITLIQPVFNFQGDFEKLVATKLPMRSLKNEEVLYDAKTGQFDYKVDQRKSIVDTVDLMTKLVTFSSSKDESLEVSMVDESSVLEDRTDKTNRKLASVFKKPLELIMEGSGEKVLLSPRQIMELLDLKTKDYLETVEFDINKETTTKVLASSGVNQKTSDWLIKNIKDNLSERFKSGEYKPVVLGVDSGPNTDGSLAKRYIEVDLSQQRMYFFDNGSLFKTYMVSTGLNYPTPVGSYKIKNKLPMGYSGIFNVWMPWWMAFEYREDIGAYLGIHELPYKLVDGQKIYRFGNYIGNRKTGGCVALAPGESKEVYDMSYPGMDVLVYQ